jgi:hypothetical protein
MAHTTDKLTPRGDDAGIDLYAGQTFNSRGKLIAFLPWDRPGSPTEDQTADNARLFIEAAELLAIVKAIDFGLGNSALAKRAFAAIARVEGRPSAQDAA